jgi:DNA-binding XRE family transcriptional regulator
MEAEPEPSGRGDAPATGPGDEPELPELPVLPGFREMALRRMSADRRRLVADLTAQRRSAGLSQTEVAARMGTSQSAVARLESGDADLRVSTLERYAAALGSQLAWQARAQPGAGPIGTAPGGLDPMGSGPAGLDPMGTSPVGTGPTQPGLTRPGYARPGYPKGGQPQAGLQPDGGQPQAGLRPDGGQPQAGLGQEDR